MPGQLGSVAVRGVARRSGRYREPMSSPGICSGARLRSLAIVAVRNAIADKGGSYDPAADERS